MSDYRTSGIRYYTGDGGFMATPQWTFSFTELFWGTLMLFGCLGMVAFEAAMMWLLVPKQ
jgi:hypothetical protein